MKSNCWTPPEASSHTSKEPNNTSPTACWPKSTAGWSASRFAEAGGFESKSCQTEAPDDQRHGPFHHAGTLASSQPDHGRFGDVRVRAGDGAGRGRQPVGGGVAQDHHGRTADGQRALANGGNRRRFAERDRLG